MPADAITTFGQWVAEGSDAQIRGLLRQADGTPVGIGAILTIGFSVILSPAGTLIRSGADALVAGGSLSTETINGVEETVFAFILSGNDTTRVGSDVVEVHALVLNITFTRTGGGTGRLRAEVRFPVTALGVAV